MDKGWGPQPFTTCKWTRVAPPLPLTLHDLQMDKGLPPPNPSRLANGQGLGPPTLSRLENEGCPPPPAPQPFTTCKWTRVGGPNPSRLANGQGLGAPQPFTTCKWTTVGQGLGPPGVHSITSTTVGQGLDPLNLSRFGVAPQINFTASTYVSKPTRRLVRRSTNQ